MPFLNVLVTFLTRSQSIKDRPQLSREATPLTVTIVFLWESEVAVTTKVAFESFTYASLVVVCWGK